MSSASATGYDLDGGSARPEGDGRLLRRVIDRLPAMVAYWDEDLRNRIASGAYLAWFGLTSEEVRGRHIREVIGDEAYAASRRHLEGALAGEEQLFQRTVTDAAGRRRHTQVSYVPDVVDGRTVGFFALVSDATERVDESVRLRKVVEEYRVLARSIPRSLTMVFDRDLRFTVADGPGRLEVLVLVPEVPELAARPQLDEGYDPVTAEIVRTGRPAVVHHDEHSTGSLRRLFEAGIGTGVGAPIKVNGRLWGVIGYGLAPGKEVFGTEPDVLGRLAEFADLVATGISSVEAWQALTDLSTVDPLTGLPNRRVFDEQLERAVRGAARDGSPLSIIILDLDHFKAVNDTDGHPAGDRVLREAASQMAAVTRGSETLARLGGEEFGLILPGTNAKGVVRPPSASGPRCPARPSTGTG